MRICVEKMFYPLIFLVVLIGTAHGQSPSPTTWRTIISPNGEFSITVPEPFVVHQEKGWGRTKIVGGVGGTGFELFFNRNSVDDQAMERAMANRFRKGNHSTFKIGKSRVHVHKYDGENIYREMVHLATPKASYSFLMLAAVVDKGIVESVVASIRLNGQQVMSDLRTEPPVASGSVSAKELKDSEIVLLALKRKQTGHIVTEVAGDGYMPPDDDSVYSRPGMIVGQPFAKYSEEGRNNNVQGTVRLRIHLKADGNIGKILVLQGLPFGLTEEAIRAASQIKFIPAEVGGKPADFEATREYTFTIY